MIGLNELEKIFSRYYVVDPPKNVLVLDKPTVSLHGETIVAYRGLQPKWRGDVIIITPQGDEETVIHETLHAQFLAGEPLAHLGGKFLIIKHRLIEKGGRFANFFKIRHRGRTVEYQQCNGCSLCGDLTQLKLYAPQGAKPRHYKLVNK